MGVGDEELAVFLDGKKRVAYFTNAVVVAKRLQIDGLGGAPVRGVVATESVETATLVGSVG